jgi:diaminopimelate decarboxylase
MPSELLREIAERHGTPFYAYDAGTIRRQLASLAPFDTVRFAQKACPNLHVQRLLREAGALVDCVSLGELERAFRAGFDVGGEPSGIVFTADVLTRPVIDRVVERRVPVNAGSEDMLRQIGERRRGHPVWLRLNPGFGHGHSRKTNTGGESSKHGIWHENLPDALSIIDTHGLDLVGLHMHIGSGADLEHLSRVCQAMVEQVTRAGRDIRAISGGGGLSIPYRSGDATVDVDGYFRSWDHARREIARIVGHPVHLEIEPGRYLVAQAGVLVAEVRATKTMGGNHFTLVDAGFNDLMRPAMYGAWHEISVVRDGRVSTAPSRPTLVAGPLCESGDVFTQTADDEPTPRDLPEARVGDLCVFRDAGAYGASMSSNYNSRPLAPEFLVDDGSYRMIRRRQTIAELLSLEEEPV